MPIASLIARLLPPPWRRWLVAVGVLALLLLVGAHVWQAYQQRVTPTATRWKPPCAP